MDTPTQTAFSNMQRIGQLDQVFGEVVDRETGRRLVRIAIPAEVDGDPAKVRLNRRRHTWERYCWW